jgi:hypothetical protein
MTIRIVASLIAALIFTVLPLRAGENAFIPIATVTPGNASATALCAKKSATVVNSTADSDQIFADYSIAPDQRRFYRLELLIPVELGGTADRRNIWPHITVGPWNAGDKAKLDAILISLVCAHTLTLEAAQKALREDWTAAYEKFVGPYPPAPATTP